MIFYVVVKDDYDNDLELCSTRKKEAAKICRAIRKIGYEEAFIYVLQVNDNDVIEYVDLIKDVRGIR